MTTTAAQQSLTACLQTENAQFDMSHFGRLAVSGSDAIDLLNRLSTNNLEMLQPGHGMSSVLTTNKGRIIDLLHVLHRGEDLLVLTSPGTQQKVAEWIDFYTFIEDVSVTDVSANTTERLYIGEQAANLLVEAGYMPTTLDANLTHAHVGDADSQILVVRSDIGEVPAYRVIAPADSDLPGLHLKTLEDEDFNMLRIEQSVAAYPAEMNEDRNPLEANLKPYINFNKGCYIGQEVVARLNTYDRVQRFMCRLELDDGLAVTPGSQIVIEGSSVGEVTTSAPGIALAFLRKRHYEDGAEVAIESDGNLVSALVRDVRPPEDND